MLHFLILYMYFNFFQHFLQIQNTIKLRKHRLYFSNHLLIFLQRKVIWYLFLTFFLNRRIMLARTKQGAEGYWLFPLILLQKPFSFLTNFFLFFVKDFHFNLLCCCLTSRALFFFNKQARLSGRVLLKLLVFICIHFFQ